MGNCLKLQTKVVKIMKMDGEILKYKPSIKVNHILSEFRGYAVSDMFPVSQYLKPETELVGGSLYYLIPKPTPEPKVQKKRVRFAEPEVMAKEESKDTTLRIKLVISKQELKEMLENGVVSMDGIVSKAQKHESDIEELEGKRYGSKSRKLALESIPEVD